MGTVVGDGHYALIRDIQTVTNVQLPECLGTVSLGEGSQARGGDLGTTEMQEKAALQVRPAG